MLQAHAHPFLTCHYLLQICLLWWYVNEDSETTEWDGVFVCKISFSCVVSSLHVIYAAFMHTFARLDLMSLIEAVPSNSCVFMVATVTGVNVIAAVSESRLDPCNACYIIRRVDVSKGGYIGLGNKYAVAQAQSLIAT